jgi:hypothetical protein
MQASIPFPRERKNQLAPPAAAASIPFPRERKNQLAPPAAAASSSSSCFFYT